MLPTSSWWSCSTTEKMPRAIGPPPPLKRKKKKERESKVQNYEVDSSKHRITKNIMRNSEVVNRHAANTSDCV
jgi:hypothetical protein